MAHPMRLQEFGHDNAESVGIELGLTRSLIESWHRALAGGRGDEDLSTVYDDAGVRP